MKRLKKRLSVLLVLALVLASLALDFGQFNAFAFDNNTGTGLVRVSIQIGANDCADGARGTDSSFRLQFIDASDTVVGTTPANAIEGRPEESAYGDPLEAEQTTTYCSTSGAGGNVQFITASLGTIAVNKSINRVQLVNTYWEDSWNFNDVIFYYSHDGGTNWTQIASGGWASGTEGAVGTWNVSYFGTNYKSLTFNPNNGNGGGAYDAIPGQTITQPSNPVRTGYTFISWAGAPARMPNASVTYFAAWSVNSYTITFDANGGSAVPSITNNFGTAVTPPANPIRTGYSFAGWQPAVPSTMPAGNTTCVAQWAINSYSVTFDANGGSATAPLTQEFGSTLTAPANPERAGYTFAGWLPAVPAVMPANNTTCVAQWTLNTYTITFDSDGGTPVTPITQSFGSVVVAPVNIAKTGYSITGWLPAVPATMPAENLTCVAQWSVNSYTVTFNANGGTAVSPVTQAYATSVTAPDNPVRPGYTFIGWTPAVPVSMPAENLTCVAQWAVNTYTISLDANGGTAVAPISQNYGTTVTAPDNPTKEGYTFTGWLPLIPDAMPAEDTTCVAQWSINSYTITFDTGGGSVIPAVTQVFGSAVTQPDNPTRAGYAFTGWQPAVPAVMPEGDLTCVAQWVIPFYTITWDANGGSGGGQNTCRSGDDPEPIDPGTKLGYLFADWSPMIMPASSDAVYTAQWVADTRTIFFDSAGGSAVASITQIIGTPVTSPPEPVRTGYTFMGWSASVPAFMPGEDMTCTAQWAINSYTITFDAGPGTGGLIQILNYGVMPLPPVVARSNYRFAGWSPAIETVTGNTTYTAQWIMLGDINASGTISALDALIVLQHVAGLASLSELELLQADVDMNGIVNNIDALKILQFASGVVTMFS